MLLRVTGVLLWAALAGCGNIQQNASPVPKLARGPGHVQRQQLAQSPEDHQRQR